MTRRRPIRCVWIAGSVPAVVLAWTVAAAVAQSSSLYLQAESARQARFIPTTQPTAPDGSLQPSAGAVPPDDINANLPLRAASLIAVMPETPKRFRVHDLINIVVRHNMQYRADGRLEQNRINQFNAKLDEWFRISDHRWRQQEFPSGDPQAKFDLTDNRRSQGRNQRQDQLTTRIQAEVIDVKPNGTLVLQARARYRYEEEVQTITLTGICRAEDVSADNAILSDRVYDLSVDTINEGAVRDTTKRGFIPRIFDALKPF